MRILIAGTANYPAMNGQATFTETLTEGLASRGHEVVSIFPSEKGASYSLQRNGVHLEALRSINATIIHPEAYFSIFSRSAVRKIIQSFHPQIIHIQDHFPVSYDVVRVGQKLGIHMLGTNHFMPENLAAYVPLLSKFKPVYNRFMWGLMLNVYNRLDIATAQSRASASLLRKQGLQIPVHPVSCGIDLDRFHRLPDLDRNAVRARYGIGQDKTVFLFVGRVDHEKRLDVLLRALKLLDREDIQLVIAGQGAEQENLKTLAAELEVGDRVRFTGFIPADVLPDLFNSADIFTMPSEAELLSIATLEAMACGLPLLLANAVALPELVSNGVNGYLFNPGDPADAAHYMALLGDQPEQWARLGNESLEKAHFHGLDYTLKQYENLYINLLAGTYSNPLDTGIKKFSSSPNWLAGNKK